MGNCAFLGTTAIRAVTMLWYSQFAPENSSANICDFQDRRFAIFTNTVGFRKMLFIYYPVFCFLLFFKLVSPFNVYIV